MIRPSTSTTATRLPPRDGTPGSPNTRAPSTTAKQPAKTSTVTPRARTSLPRILPSYRRGLLVIVAFVAVAIAPAAAPPAVRLLLLHDRHVGGQVPERQPDTALVRLDADDLHRQLVSQLNHVLRLRARPARHLRDVKEAVHARLELDERSELREADHLALDVRADRELAGDVLPRVTLE